jgi:hypothetical protein
VSSSAGAIPSAGRNHRPPSPRDKDRERGSRKFGRESPTSLQRSLSSCPGHRWLRPHPEPGKLDQRGAQPRIARFRYALFPIDRPALPRSRCQSGIGRDLPSVVEAAIETFQPKDKCNILADTPSAEQHRRRRSFQVANSLPKLRLDGLDLLKQQLQTIELAIDLDLEMRRQAAAVPRRPRRDPQKARTTRQIFLILSDLRVWSAHRD